MKEEIARHVRHVAGARGAPALHTLDVFDGRCRSLRLWPVGLLLVACCATSGPPAGVPPAPRTYGYRLSGDLVIFELLPSQYRYVTSGSTGEWIPLEDLRLNRLALAGEFNQWSTEAWPMTRSGPWWVAVRRRSEVGSGHSQFKFVVNDRFWVEPPEAAANRASVTPGSRNANLVLEASP